MRPIILELESFGPFGKKERIDFRELNHHQLFLISGRTGAGKSTLLDGISFALYGKTSGGERDPKNMKSHFTSPEIQPKVTFIFGVKGRSFQVERSASLEYFNSKGKKSKKLHKANFVEVDSVSLLPVEGSEITRPSAVDERILEIMGLSHDQFRQIVILPQGKFREFLKADSKGKEKTLEKLFNTTKYKRIENKIHDSFRESYNELKNFETRREEFLRDKNYKKSLEIEELIAQGATSLADCLEKLEVVDREILSSQGEYQKGKELKDKFEKLFNLGEAIKEKSHKVPLVEEKKAELKIAQKANLLLPSFQVQENLQKEIQDQKELLVKSKGIESSLLERREILNEEQHKNLEEKDLYDREKAHLEKYKGSLEKIELKSTLSNEINRLRGDFEIKEREINSIIPQIDKLDQEIKKLKELSEFGPKELKSLDFLKNELKEKENTIIVFEKIKKVNLEMETEKKNEEDAKELLKDLESKLKDIQKKRADNEKAIFSNYAHFLSQGLESGKSCPVCGSKEHPSPTKGTEDNRLPLQARKDELDQEIQKQEQTIRKQKDKLHKIMVTLNHLSEQLEELQSYLKTEDLGSEKAILSSLEELKKKEKSLLEKWNCSKNTKVEIEQNELNKARKLKKLDELKEAFNQIKLKQGRLEDQRDHLKEVLGEYFYTKRDEFKEMILKKTNWIKNFEDKKHQTETEFKDLQEKLLLEQGGMERLCLQIEKSEDRLNSLRGPFLEEIQNSGFRDELHFKGSLKPGAYLEELSGRIESFQKELGHLQHREDELGKELAGKKTPDLDVLKKKNEELLKKRDFLFQQKVQLEEKEKQHAFEYKRLSELEIDIQQFTSQVEVLKELDQTASGKNSYMIGLQRFILTTWLDDVLLAGSNRLNIMSQGRYELKRAKTVKDYRSQAGLDLMVIDSYTGKERDVSTLSGGEGFLASLSLALGLSDIVQSHSGGVQLDTLFIDEGFGTLDQEALDLAYKTLTDIKGKDRLVGIISHVSELKEWIPARLEVESNMKGSKTKFIL